MHIPAKVPSHLRLLNATYRPSLTYGLPFARATLKPLRPSPPSVGPIPVGPLPFSYTIPHRCPFSLASLQSGLDRPRRPTRASTGLDLRCMQLRLLLFLCSLSPCFGRESNRGYFARDILSLGPKATATIPSRAICGWWSR
jgi:hypothetical protein